MTPDLMTTVGFQASKLGSDDKAVGYVIEKSRLGRLLGCIVFVLCLMGVMLVWSEYEIHLERRTARHKLRVEEHHAAAKLAKVEMELWSHFHTDIHESQEARAVLTSLNESYDELNRQLHKTMEATAVDLGLRPEKAAVLAEKLMQAMAVHRQEAVQHAKKLVDHLVEQGKRSMKLEKHLEKEIHEQMVEEVDRMEEDALLYDDPPKAAVDNEDEDAEELGRADQRLTRVIEAFWKVWDDYNTFIWPGAQALIAEPSIFEEVERVRGKLDESEEVPSEEELVKELAHLNLEAHGLTYSAGKNAFMKDPFDYLETLLFIPKIPREELNTLRSEWKSGEKAAYVVLNEIQALEGTEKVPGSWLEWGIMEEEDDDLEDIVEQAAAAGAAAAGGGAA